MDSMPTPTPPPDLISPTKIAEGVGALLAGLYSAWRYVTNGQAKEMHQANIERLDELSQQFEAMDRRLTHIGYQLEGHIRQVQILEVKVDNAVARLDLRIDGKEPRR